MKRMICALGVLSLLGTAACSSDSDVDIGDAKHGEKLSDYADVWEGYAEAYTFSDGSDKVRIVLDENGEGTLEVGDSAPITLNVAHPPRGPRGGVLPGFAYSVRFAAVETSRLHFRFNHDEALGDWCAAQTSYQISTEEEVYSCLPNGSTRRANKDECYLTPLDTETEAQVDCNALELCQLRNGCVCTEESCAAQELLEAAPIQFAVDGALDGSGDNLEGTLLLGELNSATPIIRLTRQ